MSRLVDSISARMPTSASPATTWSCKKRSRRPLRMKKMAAAISISMRLKTEIAPISNFLRIDLLTPEPFDFGFWIADLDSSRPIKRQSSSTRNRASRSESRAMKIQNPKSSDFRQQMSELLFPHAQYFLVRLIRVHLYWNAVRDFEVEPLDGRALNRVVRNQPHLPHAQVM